MVGVKVDYQALERGSDGGIVRPARLHQGCEVGGRVRRNGRPVPARDRLHEHVNARDVCPWHLSGQALPHNYAEAIDIALEASPFSVSQHLRVV